MTTDTVTLEPTTIGDLERSLPEGFRKVALRDIRVHKIDGNRVRIETPVRHLAKYHFVSEAGHCSWKTSKGKLIIYLTSFLVEQRAENELFYLDLFAGNVQTVLSCLHEGTFNSVRDIFGVRGRRAVESLKLLDEDKLREVVKAPTDYGVLARALNLEEALTEVRASDPLAAARLRGIDAKRRLLESEGGTVSSSQAAKMLKMTRQAVDKRRKEGKLLAIELGRRGYCYPAWQFGLKGFEEVLLALPSGDFWERLSFFLNPSDLLEDQTPIQALGKGSNVEGVLRAAKEYGEHGA